MRNTQQTNTNQLLEDTVLRYVPKDKYYSFSEIILAFDDVDMYLVGQFTYEDLQNTLERLVSRKLLLIEKRSNGSDQYRRNPNISALSPSLAPKPSVSKTM